MDISESVLNPPLLCHSTCASRPSTEYPLDQYISLTFLSSSYHVFTASLSSVAITSSHVEAMVHPGLDIAMEEEMCASQERNTWNLAILPPFKDVVGVSIGLSIRYISNGSIEKLKTCLMAKGYTQTFGGLFWDTLSCCLITFLFLLLFLSCCNFLFPLVST